ncbi:hypothetical protein [Zoogloea sp.]|uniref:hypothetical protein n=1 Tax=Zoogloea sp. TaxID=49181 RepID=UPI001A576FC6|nr:hypothetical protein [Zoogloea sp.]
MKVFLTAVSAFALCATPALAQTPPPAPAQAAAQNTSPAGDTALPSPPKITRWENTGMTPTEAREWQTYNLTPNEAVNWKRAGFAPLVARTWSDKGFDPDEAREWLDSAKTSRSLMSELDQSDPSQWKREGFSPNDRLAWWEAGFVFEDALLLARAGMAPADAAWNGHEKLKQLKGGATEPAKIDTPQPGTTLTIPSLASIWGVVGPYVTFGLAVFVAFICGGLAFFLLRRKQINRQLKTSDEAAGPDSELPTTSDEPASQPLSETPPKRRPARRFALTRPATPHCLHCKSLDVRPSRMHPHRFAGINFTEYFRCRKCGRHFAIVSYTPILAAGGAVVLVLTFLTSSFIYTLSLIH